MEKTSHILIVGPAAEQLGYAHGLEKADPHYFFVQERYDQLCEARRYTHLWLAAYIYIYTALYSLYLYAHLWLAAAPPLHDVFPTCVD